MKTEKQRWPYPIAIDVANQLVDLLRSACVRLEIAGSLRRKKAQVGDVEIVYIPRFDEAKLPGEMFAHAEQNLADITIETLLCAGVLRKRTNQNGSQMFGEKNKLVQHVASGMPVDLFAATDENWVNYLVCRTGGAESNVAICNGAIARGWKWNPYGPGFSRAGEVRRMESERAVFDFAGLPYRAPEDRT